MSLYDIQVTITGYFRVKADGPDDAESEAAERMEEIKECAEIQGMKQFLYSVDETVPVEPPDQD